MLSVRATAGLVLGLGLAGCATTQQEAARLRLNSARLRASESSVRVLASDRAVRVQDVSVVNGPGGHAIVARVENLGVQTVSDLPVSVGWIVRAQRRYLNAAVGLPYFDDHLPALARGRGLVWVYPLAGRAPAGARPFVLVGSRRSVAPVLPGRLPALEVREVGLTPRGLRVSIRNRSGVPQYLLTVFLAARRGGRYVAAGRVTLAHLGTDTARQLVIRPIGSLTGSAPLLEAPPTIFS